MSWRVAKSLDNLLDEINEAAPDRSTISDGSIGDASHSSRESDHNPNPFGVVRARDFTHDPAGGLDCNKLAVFLADLVGEHPATASGAYIIWNRRIFSRDRISEGWRAYTGSNPHDHHLHLSVATAATGYDSTAPWGWATEGDDMYEDSDRKVAADTLAAVKALAAAEEDRAKVLRKAVRQQAEAIRARLREDGTKAADVAADVDRLLELVDD